MTKLHSTRGQFIPIAGMVMFTAVVLMVAVVNIYKVSRAKLKAQNMADAVALNVASQEAQVMNVMADRNEWMNHIVAGLETPTAVDPNSGVVTAANSPLCHSANPNITVGISCVENTVNGRAAANSGHVFHSKDGATNYANLVKTINQAQALLLQAYNSFLGAPGGTASSSINSGASGLRQMLEMDIPDLKNVQLAVWNTNDPNFANPQTLANSNQKLKNGMRPLGFDVHDVNVRYYKERCFLGTCIQNTDIEPATLGGLSGGGNVGWYDIDGTLAKNSLPQVDARKGNKHIGSRVGAQAMIVQQVQVPGLSRPVVVHAQSQAYVVQGSGGSGTSTSQSSGVNAVPEFHPTYWVKLGTPQ